LSVTLPSARHSNHAADFRQNPDAILADLASMLLSNLTSASAACSTLLDLKVPVIPNPTRPKAYYTPQSRSGTCGPLTPYPPGEPRELPALPLLVDAFVQGAMVQAAGDKAAQRKGQLHFLASVFANLTVVGRTARDRSSISALHPSLHLDVPFS
jgi:hypothetical protein